MPKSPPKEQEQVPEIVRSISADIASINSTQLEIIDQSGMEQATEVLSRLNRYLDNLTEDKEKLTKPLNEALKAIRAKYKPTESKLEELIAFFRTSMSKYQTKLIADQRKKEEAIANKVIEGKLSTDKAIKKLETLSQSKTPDKIATTSGSLTFKETPILKIIKLELIPREYMVPDEKKILDDLKAGKTILGATIEIIQVPVNRR